MADADRHRNKLVVGIRGADEQLRDDARAAAREAGYSDLSAATVAFWEWSCHRPGAPDPRRPADPAAVARQLLAQVADLVGQLEAGNRQDEAQQIIASLSGLTRPPTR